MIAGYCRWYKILGILFATQFFFLSPLQAKDVILGDLSIDEALVVYTPAEMLSFDIREYLQERASHLLEYSEVISHWAGYSSISPKVIISLIEYQTGIISDTSPSLEKKERPLSSLSNKVGFSSQVKDVTDQLADSYYRQRNGLYPLSTSTFSIGSSDSIKRKPAGMGNTFYDTFTALFPTVRADFYGGTDISEPYFSGALPPETMLQLPYPVGDSWSFGGSHTAYGSGDYPQSSLDFNGGSWSWGTDTSNEWVVASNEGTVKIHSSCFVEVIGTNGWSTSYYHLDNVQVSENDFVSRNSPIANYANNISQALCNGGSSTGPHLHFSLKYNGAYEHLNGVKLSGYSVHTGRDSYDTDCNYFWLEVDGSKHCAWTRLNNPGVASSVPDLVVASPSLSKTTFRPGELFTAAALVSNQGDISSAATILRFVDSPDSDIAITDTTITTEQVGVLSGSGSSLIQGSMSAPSSPGTYWIGACVDAVNGEQNTANNCSPGVQIDVSLLKGDVNNDTVVDIKDTIFALQVASGMIPRSVDSPTSDVNDDGRIGIVEAVFSLRESAGLNE